MEIDTEKLKTLVHSAVHFLDNCIDMHTYPEEQLDVASKRSRKIGLGVLGFADLLFSLELAYGSKESLKIIDLIMKTIQNESRVASHVLAKRRGPFPAIGESSWQKQVRNATITSIAPTGSTSLIAGVSQSIEPVYALSFTTTTSEGKQFTILNEVFSQSIDALPIDKTAKIQLQFVDSVHNISWLDENFKKIFCTAMDVSPEQHLKVMAQFQKYVDNSISKTINLPQSSSLDDVAFIMKQAHKLKCKGITIYRDGCRSDQVLATKKQTRLSAFRA